MAAGVLFVGLAAAPAQADDGYAGPDATYAGDGTLDLTRGGSPMVVDAQDRLLVLQSTGNPGARLTRYLASGTPDPAFTPTDLPQVRTSDSTVTVLDSGRIRVTQRPSGSSDRLVVQLAPSGSVDTAFGTDGTLALGDVGADAPFLAADDGTIVVATRWWGALRFRRYDAAGHLDASFGGDGLVDVACCGPEPEVPQAQSVQPDGAGGLVALIRHRETQALVRVGADGTVGSELAIPAPGWATSLSVDPFGGYHLHVQAGPDDTTGAQIVHLDDDLVPDTGSTAAGTAAGGAATARQVGDRLIYAQSVGSGRVALTAFTAAGIDPTYGTNGTVVTEAMQPLESDQSGGPTSVAFAVAADGRALVAASWTWYPGFFNPYEQYAARIETYDANGQRTSRTDTRGAPETMHVAVAEQVGSAFLLQSTASTPPGVFTTPTVTPRVRRLVPPRAEAPLGPVQGAAVTVAGGQATVTWQRPAATPGLVVTGYQVTQWVAGSPDAVATKDLVGLTTALTLPAAAPLTAHRIEIRPKGFDGALGPVTTLVVVPGLPVDPFLRLLDERFDGSATPEDQALATSLLGDGSVTPAYLVRAAAQTDAWRSSVEPVVRLYLAYFQRPPDPTGLRYWVAKRKAGTSVARISAVFADSSEFKRTYGSLSNRTFVELVYANVLGRAGDATGLAYWTGRLDRRVTSRGHLMASFSESSEHVRRTRATVDVVSIHWGLLGRTPTKDELTTWAGPSPAGDAEAMVTAILQTPELQALLS